jgi:hypothetical protein
MLGAAQFSFGQGNRHLYSRSDMLLKVVPLKIERTRLSVAYMKNKKDRVFVFLGCLASSEHQHYH